MAGLTPLAMALQSARETL